LNYTWYAEGGTRATKKGGRERSRAKRKREREREKEREREN